MQLWISRILLAVVTAGLILFANGLRADEPVEEFLEALRENQYYDLALQYLNQLEQSQLGSDEFRQQLPFEKAETLVASTELVKNLDEFESRLDQAQKLIDGYSVPENSPSQLAKKTQYQGNLYYRRSKIFQLRAASDRLTASEKEAFLSQARDHLNQALNSYQDARDKIRLLIDPTSDQAIRISASDASSKAKLKQFQGLYTQIRFRLPLVMEQLGDTYPEGAAERVKLWNDAAKEFRDVYDDYYRYPAGLDSCLYAARVQQKLGKYAESLITLEELFNLGDNSTFKSIKRRALLQACEAWGKLEKYPADEVIDRLGPIVEVLNRVEVREPEWLRIQMELADAFQIKSVNVKAAGGPNASSDANALERRAGRLWRAIARIPSDYRDAALKKLSQFNMSFTDDVDTNTKPPTTFADAKQRGRDQIASIESLLGQERALRQQLVVAATKEQQDSVSAELQQTTADISTQAKASLETFDLALRLADGAVDRSEINGVRYLQSFCHFAMQHYYESALIGEFLLDKYPNVDSTRPATMLMMKSYLVLYDQAKDSDKTFERNRLQSACREVLQRWPGSHEAAFAASTLVRLAINDKNYADAEQVFQQIPENDAARPGLAAKLGQVLWFDYRQQLPATEATVGSLKNQLASAVKFLEAGTKSVSREQLDQDTAIASLLLVDAYLESGETSLAVQQLETVEIAPLDLVKQKHPVVSGSKLAEFYKSETFKIAVKTYLAAMRGNADQARWIEKANGVLAAMRENMENSDDPKDRQRVTAIYRLIASELKQQFENLSSIEDKEKFAASLASFLGAIEKDSRDAKTILWAGSTLLSTANALSDLSLQEAASPLFLQADSAFTRAEEIGFENDPQQSVMQAELQRQRALALRGAGKFDQAIQQFVELLQANERVLAVQLDAAETLQVAAKATHSERFYQQAMMGANPVVDPATKQKSNLIWGWRKIVLATRGNDKFSDAFYQSLFHYNECRLEYGLLTKRTDALKSALQEIENAEKRDPAMGGNQWKIKFDALKKRIQLEQ